MIYAKFDRDGSLIYTAENVPGLNLDGLVEIPFGSDPNNLFLVDGVAGPKKDVVLNVDRTVLASDGRDTGYISGFPVGAALMVNQVKVYTKGLKHAITASPSDTFIFVELTGAYSSNSITIKVGTAIELMDHVRAERDKKLSATDWTQMADAPLTEDQQKNWTNYRTALRNLPDDQPNANIDTVIWPTKPM